MKPTQVIPLAGGTVMRCEILRFALRRSISLVCACVISIQAIAQTSGLSVQFVARGIEPKNFQSLVESTHDLSPSHVFMIMKVATRSGIKEEAYGFYPEHGLGIIKGPGMLK